MKLRNLKDDSVPTLMIIPMIDIIFFMLVFFMMSMLTMVTQRTIPVKLPQAVTAAVDVTKTIPVTVDAEGRVLLEDDAVALEALGGRLKDAVSAATGEGREAVVVLRGDEKAPYGVVIQVLDVVKKSGSPKLVIATEKAR